MRVQIIEERNHFRVFSAILLVIFLVLLLFDFLNIKQFNLFMAIFVLLPIGLVGRSALYFKNKGTLDLEEKKLIVNKTNEKSKEIDLGNIESIKLYEESIEKSYLSKIYTMKLIIEYKEREEIFKIIFKERYLELF